MSKDREFPETLTVMDRDQGSTDNGESLSMYMKQLQKMPLLTKDEEVKLARQIRTSKVEILTICSQVPECVSEIYMLKELPVTELRKLFFTMIDEESEQNEVQLLVKKLETLIASSLKDKKNAGAKLIAFLNTMGFTMVDLIKLSKPVLEYGDGEQVKSLKNHLALFRAAKNRMIECNLRLVFSRAKMYLNKGMSLEDLLQEGNIGLIKAIEKYDVEKGFKFGTYATWWVDQALGRAVADKSRLIRVPVHMVENINRLTKANRKLTQKLGRDPNVQELSEHTDLSEDKIKKVKKVATFPQSLEEPTGEIGIPLSEYLVDYDTPNPYQVMERKEIAQKVRFLLSRLSPREEKIIRMRFGIGEKKTSVLSTIGNKFNVSGERIRQILKRTMSKLDSINSAKEYERDWIEFKRSHANPKQRTR